MRRFLIIATLTLLGGGVLYQLLADQQGFVLISAGHYVVETSLWTAALLVLAAALLAWLLYRLWRLVFLPGRWLAKRSEWRRGKSRNRTLQGMRDFIEGHWPGAADKLEKSAARSELPAVNYLGAAAASHQMGDREAAARLLAKAEAAGQVDSYGAGLLRVRFHLQDRDFNRALPLVEELHRRDPRHPAALRLLASTRKGMRNWRGVEALLKDLDKYQALSPQELAVLEVEVHGEILATFAVSHDDRLDAAEQDKALDRLWHDLPRHLHSNPLLIAEYSRQLVAQGRADKAEALLSRFLAKHWEPRLVDFYGTVPSDTAKQLVVAEAWLREHADNAVLLRALGRLSARAELWGKARAYLEKSLSLSAAPETHAELGHLLVRLDDAPAALQSYRQGLEAALKTRPLDY